MKSSSIPHPPQASSQTTEYAPVLHLVTPQSQDKPLCGTTSPDAVIGAYCEHLDDAGEWCREVFGKGGKAGTACDACLTLYPSLLWNRPGKVGDFLNLQSVISISPYPMSFRQDYSAKGFVNSNDFEIERDPFVIGQRREYGKTALSVAFRIVPKPLGKR